MTPDQHSKELRKMERARSKKLAEKKEPITLAAKLEVCKEIKVLDEQIHQHKLHYFDLTN